MVKTHKVRRFKQSLINGFFALVMIASSVTTLTSIPVYAAEDTTKPVTPTEFCSKLSLKSTSERNACIDGWKGEDCSAYKLTHDEQHVEICQQGARGRSNIDSQGGKTTSDDPTPTVEDAVKPSETFNKDEYERTIKASCAQFRNNASSIATNAAEVWCLYGGLGQDGKEGIPKDDCLTKPELRGSDLNQKACLQGSKTGYSYLAGSNGKTPQPDASYRQAVATACQTFQGTDNSGAASVWCLYGGLGKDGNEGIPKDDCLTKPELRGSDLNQKACLYGSKTGYTTIYYNGGGTNPSANVSKPATNFSNSGENDILNMLINQTASQIANGGLPTNNIPGLPGGSNSSVINNFNAPDNLYGSYVNGAGKQQPLRVTRAPGNNRPVIIFINGGGFHNDDQMGDKVAPDAVKEGYTSIVATYRLGSAGLYYMYEDVLRAVRHVRNNAAMYGIDASRMVIWGDSAGGSLAMRVATSGKAGLKAAVGWSAPTNAYTILFHSFPSFADAIDHSTCLADPATGIQTSGGANGGASPASGTSIPGLSELAGALGSGGAMSSLPNGSTVLQGVTGGAQGISSVTQPGSLQIPGLSSTTGSSSLFGNNPVTGIPNPFQTVAGNLLSGGLGNLTGGGGDSPLNSVLSTLMLAQYGLQNGNNAKTTATNLAQGLGNLTGNTEIPGIGNLANPLPGSNISINPSILSADTFLKCIDNLDAASPALYASPLSPPTYLAGFTSDPVVPPQQAYDLRDKLRQLGIPSEAWIKQSDVHSFMPEGGKNHCDYCKDFLKPTFAFINKYINPKKDSGGSGGGGASTGGGTNTGGTGNNSGAAGGNNVDPEYKAAIQQACNGFGQVNPAAGISCLYGGLGQNGTVGKPQNDCMTNQQFKDSPLNQQACQVGSSVGNSLINK